MTKKEILAELKTLKEKGVKVDYKATMKNAELLDVLNKAKLSNTPKPTPKPEPKKPNAEVKNLKQQLSDKLTDCIEFARESGKEVRYTGSSSPRRFNDVALQLQRMQKHLLK